MLNTKRLVLKVGSALIAPNGTQCSGQYLLAIADFVNKCRERDIEVIIVSSGSVAAGRALIDSTQKPSIAEKQAMAAVGQTRMMANWARFFDVPCAQILITHDDLRNRTRYVNAKNTLRELLKNQIIPVVNENDSVAVEELTVGDNDNLAGYIALLTEADTLIICSDVDGLYDKNPKLHQDASKISEVTQIDDSIYQLASGTTTSFATGGMRTKIQAADKATSNGIDTYIISGQIGEGFQKLLQGLNPGTLFKAQVSRSTAKKKWLESTLRTKGDILVDVGAAKALIHRGASLLPSGVTDVRGDFNAGDPVNIIHDSNIIAKGLTLYNAKELLRIKGQKSHQIQETLGYFSNNNVVHRDDLVLCTKKVT